MKGIILFLSSVALGILIFFFFLSSSSTKETVLSTSTKSSTFSFDEAPTFSLQGTITSVSGKVLWQSRTATELAVLLTPKKLRQGEKIFTKENGAVTIGFSNGLKLSLSPDAKLEFAQTLPEHIVVNQSYGSVHYISSENSSVSIRVLHVLADISHSSDVEIQSQDGIVTLSVRKGKVAVAFNNLENVSTTATINEGEQYIYTDEPRNGNVQ